MITTSKGTLLFTYPKYFKFKKPTIRTDIQGSGAHYSIVVSSDVFASGVYIGFKGFNSYVEDNFFDITDSSAIRLEIELDSAEAIETLRRELTVRSVYDIGR